jgi:hypothetical protein
MSGGEERRGVKSSIYLFVFGNPWLEFCVEFADEFEESTCHMSKELLTSLFSFEIQCSVFCRPIVIYCLIYY